MDRQTRVPPLRGQSRRAWRGSWLLASTALSAVLAHPAPLRAQNIPANTTPQGGTVVGGSANIAQAPGSTTITQSSNRAAINWQSYNVGSNAHVTYVQPSSSAITLNRVVTPSPSVIAGHISANGQIVLINQSGVVFTKGAEVTAQSVIISTSNISNSDFMAGKMNFSGTPNPGAKIVNDGKITARQAGLVGLVAPQVANNGIISARLGQVVLAGADAFTLDLYGDKLVSLDVTKAVREVDLNGKSVPALVTNKGLILADGGRITLTAADADALVSQLLQVGGTLRADSAGGRTGTISMRAVGGGINIAGNLLARGTAAGSSGGKVEAVATGTVAVASNAVIDASGQGGGGTIALGTDLQRAAEGAADTNAPRAAAVSIASGAKIKADATSKGDGGKVTLLSAKETDYAGTISATGGMLGGDGGIVEISSDGVISLGGTVIDTAVDGQAGEILLDPATLIVTSGATSTLTGSTSGATITFGDTSAAGTSFVDPSELASLSGTIVLEAGKLLSVESAITNSSADLLELSSARDLSIGASISVAGALEINAAGTLDIGAALNGGTITLTDASNGGIHTSNSSVIDINGVITGTALVLNVDGAVAEKTGGGISVASLTGSVSGDALLADGANTISALGDFTAGGTLDLIDRAALAQSGTLSGADVTLSADGLALNGKVSASNALDLISQAGVTETGTGTLEAAILTGSVTGDARLTGAANNIGTLGGVSATGTLALTDNTALQVKGGVKAQDITLAANGALAIDSGITASSGGDVALAASTLSVNGGSIAAPSGTISIAPYGSGTLDVGGSTAGGLILSSSLLAALDTSASVLNFGSAAGYEASLTELEGNLSLRPTLVVDSTGSLIQTGTLTGHGAVTLSGASLALDGKVNAASLGLDASGEIIQASTGALNISTLTGHGGDIQLVGKNTIGTLGALGSGGGIEIDNTGTMTLGGAVSATTGLALATAWLLEGAGGSLSAATIALAPYDDGAIDLGGTAVSGLQLSQSLVSAFATAATVILGEAAGHSAGSIVSGGAISFGNALLSLNSTGGITQGASAGLSVATLTATADDIALNGANSIAVLNGVTATGGIAVRDNEALDVAGAVSAGGDLSLSAPGLTVANALSGANISLASDSIVLDSGGTVAAPGGIVAIGPRTPDLTVDLGGNTAGLDLSGTLLGAIDAAALDISTQGSIIADGSASVAMPLLSLSGNGITFAGTLSAADTLALSSSAGVTATAADTLSAATLMTSGTFNGDLDLSQGTNEIGTLGPVSLSGSLILADAMALAVEGPLAAHAVSLAAEGLEIAGRISTTDAIALNSTGTLDQSGALTGQSVSLTGTSITLNAPVNAGSLALFASSGGVSETGSGLNVDTLTGSITGDAVLTGDANTISTLANFTDSGMLSLKDDSALTQTGSLSAASVTLTGSSLTLDGVVTATALSLNESTGISQTATGALDVSTLTGIGTSSGAILLGGTGNAIGTLTALAAGQNILLDNASTLDIAGNVSAGTGLTLQGAGFIESGSGTVTARTLTTGAGSLTGGLTLDGTNSIGTLGALAAGGDVLLTNESALTLTGPVSTPGTLTLTDTGAVTEAGGGTLALGGLTGSIGGALSLTGANSIGTLGALAADGDIVIGNTGTMTLGGAVSATGSLALATAGLLEGTGGSLSGTTIALALYDNGAIDLGGSSVSGLQLSPSLVSAFNAAAMVVLGNAAGHSASSIVSENAVSFANTLVALDSTGGITQSGTLTGTTLDLNGTSLGLDGLVNASLLNLSASSAISESGTGALNAATLAGLGSTGGNIALDGANSIAVLNGLIAAGNIDVRDNAALKVAGAVSAGNSLALSAPGLTLANTLSGANVSLIADSILDNGGTVTAPGGFVLIAPRTPGLAVDIGGNAAGLDLSGTLLGAINAAALDIITQGSLVTEGSASAATPLLFLSGNGITLGGTLTTPDILALSSGAGVTATSADHLSAATLLAGGTINGNLDLSRGTNEIGTLGTISLSGGNLILADATALTVEGPLSANAISLAAAGLDIAAAVSANSTLALNSSGTLHQSGALTGQAVSLTGTSLTLSAPVNAGTLALSASNGVNETGGGLNVTTLTGSVTGNAALNGGGNSIGTLANFTATGALNLADNAALTQAGSLSAADATLSAAGLHFTGNVTTPGTLALASSNGVSQSGGSVNTGVLTSLGIIGGNIAMTQAGNVLPDVRNLAATGVIDLASSSLLGQTGTLSASAVTLTAPSLALNGMVNTPGALQLNGGSASEGAGAAINAGLLTTGGGSLSGSAVLNSGANSIASLGNFTAGGGLALADSAALAINGPVSLGGTLALADASSITQTGGSIAAAALTSDGGNIGGNAVFGQAGNAIPVLGPFAATGNLLLNTGGALETTGNVSAGGTLSLHSGGAITQAGGLISAALLNASGTAIDLGGTAIGLLGNVSAGGDANIANAGGLSGTLSARDATLGSAGSFAMSGDARIGNALLITANGPVDQTGGAISAGTGTITASAITLSGATDIGGGLALRASGNILHEAGSLNAGTLTGMAGQLAEFGAATDIGTLGSFLMGDSSFILTNDGPLTLVGPLVANVVSITAAGLLTLEGSDTGGLFLSGSTLSNTATKPRTGVDSVLAVTGSNPAIVQTGTFYIDSGPNLATYLGDASPLAGLFMSLASNGTIALAPTPGILEAPNTDLVLAAGTGGMATGNVNVLHLEVLSALSVQMTGFIGNITGPTAAGQGSAFPFPQPGYRFNACPIGSVNCTILPIEGLPQANPLENFDISPRKRRKLDKNVTLPGVAARDF